MSRQSDNGGDGIRTARPGAELFLALVYKKWLSSVALKKHKCIPRAAVLRVPKGRFRSETGSQTSISPSRIMLRHMRWRNSTTVNHALNHAAVKSIRDVRREAACAYVLPIKVRVILAFPSNTGLIPADKLRNNSAYLEQ